MLRGTWKPALSNTYVPRTFTSTNLSWQQDSLVTQTVENLPAMQETGVQFLGQEDPLEEGMATHSSILAWRTPWTEDPDGLQSIGSQRVGYDWSNLARLCTTIKYSISSVKYQHSCIITPWLVNSGNKYFSSALSFTNRNIHFILRLTFS